jgi:type VI secretion system secreted protein VgrG
MQTLGVVTLATLTIFGFCTQAEGQFLGSANSFAVLAGSTVTNTGLTVLSGNLGVDPGTAITGFPPGIVTMGSMYADDAVALQAQADVLTAYNSLAGEAFTDDLTGQNLGGMTLTPGVYHFDSSAFLTGNLTLDALGNPNARFDFQIGSTLITATSAEVNLINGADGCNVFWQVGSSATLDADTSFEGHILASQSITLNAGADIVDGSALATTGAVTLASNSITEMNCSSVPGPSAFIPWGVGALAIAKRRLRASSRLLKAR